ncbi:hypothetical protein AHF37_09978 [Paragonimus kellicotti]|nr:hypothetical protein AHF37_09978 [Paragonimus kellicotti]
MFKGRIEASAFYEELIQPAPVAWQNVFILAAAISCLCGVVYGLFVWQAPLNWIVQEQSQPILVEHSETSDTDSVESNMDEPILVSSVELHRGRTRLCTLEVTGLSLLSPYSDNLEINRRIIEALRRMCLVQPGVGPDLAFYMREILVPLNYYFERTKDSRDQIIYKESMHADIYDAIDQLVKLFLNIAGPELETAERNIKKAIPTYQINSDF